MSKEMKSAHRQMGAVVGKLMDSLESVPEMQDLHPITFDLLRRRIIKACWDSFNTGLWLGKNEDGIYGSEPRAKCSEVPGEPVLSG